MSIIDEIKNLCNWHEDNYGILTYYLDSDDVLKHYEIIITSYNYKNPKEDNALGNLYFVDNYNYNGEKLFARTILGEEATIKNLILRAANDFMNYEHANS